MVSNTEELVESKIENNWPSEDSESANGLHNEEISEESEVESDE